jgi:hypothetical protein
MSVSRKAAPVRAIALAAAEARAASSSRAFSQNRFGAGASL